MKDRRQRSRFFTTSKIVFVTALLATGALAQAQLGRQGRSGVGAAGAGLPAAPTGTGIGHADLLCTDCHDPHGGPNLYNIWELLETPSSGTRPVLFLNLTGPNSFADGDAVYDGVCEVCHTQTDYHRNDPSGDHLHFAGFDCGVCHDHWNDFLPTLFDHPEAVTDCSNCHSDRVTGEPDILGTHDNQCASCHDAGFSGTILGPFGTWQGECSECHNPSVAETGNMDVHTKGHRCVVCHGEQRATSDLPDMHSRHAREADCSVCHGFIPDVGTEIGTGDMAVCSVCHDTTPTSAPAGPGPQMEQRLTTMLVGSGGSFHRRHPDEGVGCLECHGGVRPPIDVVPGPVGGATHVCDVCHVGKSPSEFQTDGEDLHERHAKELVHCGSCHADANIQDDLVPMPPIDDSRRMMVDRFDYNECAHCHEGGEFDSPMDVHDRHVAGQKQWCHNCHEGSDPRPAGLAPPVTAPSEACQLCHDNQSYNDAFPFDVHERHAEDVKCSACHQLTPPLTDWPPAWLGG